MLLYSFDLIKNINITGHCVIYTHSLYSRVRVQRSSVIVRPLYSTKEIQRKQVLHRETLSKKKKEKNSNSYLDLYI